MALFGLFGKKEKKDDDDSAYFLDQDSAKTFGNIDYMRTPKTVKKTFPTVNGVKGAEIVEVVSATEKTQTSDLGNRETSSAEANSQNISTFEPKKLNTRVDSSMDIFLNMAKDIKKQ